MTKTELEEFATRAERAYAERWKAALEPDHFGELFAVEPDSGDCVLGKTIWDLDEACDEKFGTKLVHIFRVGGGAAMRIGGASRYARIS